MSGRVENGYRAHFKCERFHDGEAGFQVPLPDQAVRGATLVAAMRPSAGKRPGRYAFVGDVRYEVIDYERSSVPGFYVLLLKEA